MSTRRSKRTSAKKAAVQAAKAPDPKEEKIYEEGDIIAVFEEAHPDKFNLALVDADVLTKDEEVQISIAYRTDKPNFFYPATRITIEQKYIITYIAQGEVKLVDLKKKVIVSATDGESYDATQKIKLKIGSYRKLTALAEKFNPDPVEDQSAIEEEDEEDEEEEEEQEEEADKKKAPVPKKKTVKKIVTKAMKAAKTAAADDKKKAPATKKATKKATKRATKDKKVAEAEAPAGGKTRKSKTSKVYTVYKKGKFNPGVTIRDKMEQLDNESEIPNLDGGVNNNNRELIRAVNIGSTKLLNSVLYSNSKISQLNFPWGIHNKVNALRLALTTGQDDLLDELLKAMDHKNKDNDELQLCGNQVSSIGVIETGFNDKYAYGVATRAVNMSRGGRQGNNAFTLDRNFNYGQRLHYLDIEFMMKNNKVTLKAIKKILDWFPEQMNTFYRYVQTALLAGNRQKAAYIITENLKHDEHTYNKFHRLSLTGTSEKSLKDIQKRNCTKQAQGVGKYCPIHCAAINPNVAVLEKILTIKPEFNVKDDHDRKPVHYAACCETTAPLEYLIKNLVDTRDADMTKKTPLMYACEAGRLDCVKLLLGPNRSNIEAKDKTSHTAIHYAALGGHSDCIKALIEAGADINKTGPERQTALHLAAGQDDVDTINFLIDCGASNTRKDKFKRTALVVAVMNGSFRAASILLRHGAPFDVPDSSNNFALHYACAYGYPEMIDLLIEAGCDPNTPNAWKLNPITVALLKGYFECVKRMLDHPTTDVNCIDNDGRSLLSNTVKTITPQSFENFIFLLDQKNADPDSKDRYGLSTLHHLCRITVQRVFDTSYASVSHTYHKSQRAKKMKECQKLYEKFLKELIAHEADINLKTSDGFPPIFLAIQNRNITAIEILLDQPDIDLNVSTNDNETILHFLTSIMNDEKFTEIVEKILSKIKSPDEILNKIADTGKNCVHVILESYVKSHRGMLQRFESEIRQELTLTKKEKIDKKKAADEKKRLAKLKKASSKRSSSKKKKEGRRAKKSSGMMDEEDVDDDLEAEDDEDLQFTGLKGGARTKMTARKTTSWGYKAPRKKFATKKAMRSRFVLAPYNQNSNNHSAANHGEYALSAR